MKPIEFPIGDGIDLITDEEGPILIVDRKALALSDDEAMTLRDALDAAMKLRSGPPRKR